MAQSEQLRLNENQHKPKNAESTNDDKAVAAAMQRVIDYLNHRLNLPELGYYLEYVKSLALREMMDLIRSYNERVEFANLTNEQSNIRQTVEFWFFVRQLMLISSE